jgi:hypothetical protein
MPGHSKIFRGALSMYARYGWYFIMVMKTWLVNQWGSTNKGMACCLLNCNITWMGLWAVQGLKGHNMWTATISIWEALAYIVCCSELTPVSGRHRNYLSSPRTHLDSIKWCCKTIIKFPFSPHHLVLLIKSYNHPFIKLYIEYFPPALHSHIFSNVNI